MVARLGPKYLGSSLLVALFNVPTYLSSRRPLLLLPLPHPVFDPDFADYLYLQSLPVLRRRDGTVKGRHVHCRVWTRLIICYPSSGPFTRLRLHHRRSRGARVLPEPPVCQAVRLVAVDHSRMDPCIYL